uniref:Sperm associated antigen 16 n=1 Tax=Suricata suricatta TaxID=37032 RepID=A0A673SUT9_SURSU
MADKQAVPMSALQVLEEALGMDLTAAGDTAEAVAAEGAYYLEQVTITEASEDDYEYEEIPDDNFSIPEGEEDLAKAIKMVQETATDTQILVGNIYLVCNQDRVKKDKEEGKSASEFLYVKIDLTI